MTRDEKINTLKAIIQECEEYQWQRKETLFEIIKDLEQEPVLNKIKAEIEEPLKINESLHTKSAKTQAISLSWCIDIINKYLEPQAESKVEQ